MSPNYYLVIFLAISLDIATGDEEDVLVLTRDNFERTLKEYEHLLVEFCMYLITTNFTGYTLSKMSMSSKWKLQ